MDGAAILRNGALGAIAGIAASLVMDAAQAGMAAAKDRLGSDNGRGGGSGGGGYSSEDSTVKAADWIAETATGEPVPKGSEQTAGAAVHFGFGALLGAIYGAAGTAFPVVRSGFGLPFGAASWAAADETLIPALGLGKPPTEVPASEQAGYLAMHLVFGAALEGSLRLLENGAGTLDDKLSGRRR